MKDSKGLQQLKALIAKLSNYIEQQDSPKGHVIDEYKDEIKKAASALNLSDQERNQLMAEEGLMAYA